MKIKAFYSDPHFGHKNIIRYCNRPFADVNHMTEELIKRYNEAIGPEDAVLWLGDCAFCSTGRFKDIMDRLNGSKLLVIGNHDRSPAVMASAGFDLVMEECFMVIAGRTCRIKHFPYVNAEPLECQVADRYADKRPPRVPGEVLIHGHTHQSTSLVGNMVHVGVDSWDWRPAPYEEVARLVAQARP